MNNTTFQNGRKAQNTWLANAALLAYANIKIEALDTHRRTLTKQIAELSVETVSPKQIELLSGYLDAGENVNFDDKRKVVDGLISQIRDTNGYVQKSNRALQTIELKGLQKK